MITASILWLHFLINVVSGMIFWIPSSSSLKCMAHVHEKRIKHEGFKKVSLTLITSFKSFMYKDNTIEKYFERHSL